MQKLYETQSYLNNTATTVVDYRCEEGRHKVRLKESIFFPEEGGQYADTGKILFGNTETKLLDGQIEDGEIWYYVEDAIPVDEAVILRLDWPKRYSRMQQHSGEHVMSGIIHNRYGFDNVGFHLSDEGPVTLVMNEVLTREQVLEIERMANDVVYMNLPIIDTYPTAEGLKFLHYRSKIEIEGQVRLITIGEEGDAIDVCACCAPHVKRTGEIGIIKVVSVAAYKGGTQIGILCGKRAMDFIRAEHEMIDGVARSFSTAIDNIPGCVDGLRAEIGNLKETVTLLQEKLLIKEIENLPDGENGVIFVEEEINSAGMKTGFNAIKEKFPGFVGIFNGSDDTGYRYYAGSRTKDSTELGTLMKERLGAQGGGKSDMIQGRVMSTKNQIKELFY